jgi:hypothetical protein
MASIAYDVVSSPGYEVIRQAGPRRACKAVLSNRLEVNFCYPNPVNNR